jgi:hypothetical protein
VSDEDAAIRIARVLAKEARRLHEKLRELEAIPSNRGWLELRATTDHAALQVATAEMLVDVLMGEEPQSPEFAVLKALEK